MEAVPVGRTAELEVVEQFLDGLQAGPSALVLHGDPGIGKTTLWQAALLSARQRPLAAMSCRPAEAESALPFLGLGDLLSAIPIEVISELPDPQFKALEIALLIADADRSPLQQRAVAVALLNVLLKMARSVPVLVAIDDAQWLDLPSRRVLRFALRRIGAAPVGVLIATRVGNHVEDVLGVDSTGGPITVHHLTIGPLASRDLIQLMRSRLGASVSGPLLKRVEQASGGNPLFALELGRALADSPDLAQPGRPLTIPARLTEVVSSRLLRLSETTRKSLLIAAALSRPTIDLVQRALGQPASALDELTEGVDAGVIEIHGASIRFVHPLLASVLYSQATAPELRQLHRRLADLAYEPEERARHLGLSTAAPDEAVAAAIASGAAHAGARGAPDIASALFEQAARLTPPESTPAAVSRILDAADQHLTLGDASRAKLLLEEVLAKSPPGSARARALHRLGRVRGLDGRLRDALPILLQAIDEVHDDVALTAALQRDLAFIRLQVGDPRGALPHARAAHEAALASGEEALLAETLAQLCMTECAVGNDVPPGLVAQAMALDVRVGTAPVAQHPGWGGSRFWLATALKFTDQLQEARQLLHSMLTEYTNRGDEGSLDTVLFHLGELELWAGNWQIAAEHSAALRDLSSRTGQIQTGRRGLLLEAMLDEGQGRTDDAISTGKACLDLCERFDDLLGVVRCLGLLGRVELARQHPAAAVEYLRRGVELESAAGYDPALCRVLPDAIEALIAVGQLADAEKLASRLESHGTNRGRPWAAAAGARCRALLYAAMEDLTQAQAGLERALDNAGRLGQPLEQARSLLALGIVQRRQKKKKDARQTLERALGIFEALGARRWSELTRIEQGRIGGRPASPHELTATEARVAQLVAEGLTNREVAGTMFLSEKTIETNLTRIYEKLAVDSRRHLARKLRQAVPES